MDVLDALILGLIQGLTEFLPVSSSGHLVVGKAILGYQAREDLFFELVVHMGTLGAVIAVYRNSLKGYFSTLFGLLKRDGRNWRMRWEGESNLREIAWILLAMIPTGILGLLIRKYFDVAFQSLVIVGVMFFVTGVVLFFTRSNTQGGVSIADMGWKKALLIGFSQGIAVMPGISRSGSTIAAALFAGLRRDEAARFSFLLSIPAILGAMLLEILKSGTEHLHFLPLLVGGVTATVVGFGALVLLIRLVRQGQLAWFSIYLWALSALLIARHFGYITI